LLRRRRQRGADDGLGFRQDAAHMIPTIQPVTSLSAGPPLGGLHLNPPLPGGFCEGVVTMPSASPVVRPRCLRYWQMTCRDEPGHIDQHGRCAGFPANAFTCMPSPSLLLAQFARAGSWLP
jgi:hypothetical protein